jgi:hypothetical protein
MLNVHVAPRSKFNVLSNGALCFAVSLIVCKIKWIKLFTETVIPFKLQFQHIGLISLQENQVHFSKGRIIRVQKQHKDFIFTLYSYMSSAFERHGNT